MTGFFCFDLNQLKKIGFLFFLTKAKSTISIINKNLDFFKFYLKYSSVSI